jgi:hypothetical protein
LPSNPRRTLAGRLPQALPEPGVAKGLSAGARSHPGTAGETPSARLPDTPALQRLSRQSPGGARPVRDAAGDHVVNVRFSTCWNHVVGRLPEGTRPVVKDLAEAPGRPFQIQGCGTMTGSPVWHPAESGRSCTQFRFCLSTTPFCLRRMSRDPCLRGVKDTKITPWAQR